MTDVCVIGRFECFCLDGYGGQRCERDINECLSNPCQHGGTCLDRKKSFICQCVIGFEGQFFIVLFLHN